MTILKPVKESNKSYWMEDTFGNKYTLPESERRFLFGALRTGKNISIITSETDLKFGTKTANVTPNVTDSKVLALKFEDSSKTETKMVENDVRDILKTVIQKKPSRLKMDELWWKVLIRSVLREKNVVMTGPAGCGKTFAVQCVSKVFPERELFIFNMGATQDPRSFLIGNTHFDRENGTYFAQSEFIRAIQTPNAIILLDELSRAHPEAGNILMPVLDYIQRYVRLDEADDCAKISVAPGVCFLATANIGAEYTGTRVQDRALMDRFEIIEMRPLNANEEEELLVEMYSDVDKRDLRALAEIADATRKNVKSAEAILSTIVSTRASVEMAELLRDGFNLAEAAEVKIFPLFPDDGGQDSERTFVKQLVQKYLRSEDSEDKETPFADEMSELPDDKPF